MESKQYIKKLQSTKELNFIITVIAMVVSFLIMLVGYIINFIWSFRESLSVDKMDIAWKQASIILVVIGTSSFVLLGIYLGSFIAISNHFIKELEKNDNA